MPDVLQSLTDLYAVHGYWVLFLTVMLENAGIPVPGETALLAAGYLASPDAGHRLHVWTVVVVAAVAAVIGDNIGYWLGRRLARPRLAAGRRFLFLTPTRMASAERYFHRYGVLTVFVARFIFAIRVIAGPAAGASLMPWGRFAIANASGAVVWAFTITLLGYYFGHAWDLLHKWLGRGAWGIIGVVVLVVVVWKVRNWIRRKPDEPRA